MNHSRSSPCVCGNLLFCWQVRKGNQAIYWR